MLGPELYNIISNDLFLFLVLEIANYADDNSLFTVAPTIPKVLSDLEQESICLLNWIRNNDKFHLLLSDPNENLMIKIGKYAETTRN